MSGEPWYHEGLRFRCTQCGNCCSGEPGFVWVTEADITAIAERRGMDRDAFRSEFVRNVGDRLSLTERPDGDCSMLDEKSRRCTVYEVRPIQCRTWPFWRSNVESPQTWQETCEVCPGAGQGDLVPLVQIETQVAARDV